MRKNMGAGDLPYWKSEYIIKLRKRNGICIAINKLVEKRKYKMKYQNL